MYSLTATVQNLGTNEVDTVEIKTPSTSVLSLHAELLFTTYHIQSWTLLKLLPEVDAYRCDTEWSTGNSGINAGAFLAVQMEDF